MERIKTDKITMEFHLDDDHLIRDRNGDEITTSEFVNYLNDDTCKCRYSMRLQRFAEFGFNKEKLDEFYNSIK